LRGSNEIFADCAVDNAAKHTLVNRGSFTATPKYRATILSVAGPHSLASTKLFGFERDVGDSSLATVRPRAKRGASRRNLNLPLSGVRDRTS
jgi:hypothetical protein